MIANECGICGHIDYYERASIIKPYRCKKCRPRLGQKARDKKNQQHRRDRLQAVQDDEGKITRQGFLEAEADMRWGHHVPMASSECRICGKVIPGDFSYCDHCEDLIWSRPTRPIVHSFAGKGTGYRT